MTELVQFVTKCTVGIVKVLNGVAHIIRWIGWMGRDRHLATEIVGKAGGVIHIAWGRAQRIGHSRNPVVCLILVARSGIAAGVAGITVRGQHIVVS